MERENHQLLNIIFFVGLVITIATTITLPMMSWSHKPQKEIVIEKIQKHKENKTDKPERLTFNF